VTRPRPRVWLPRSAAGPRLGRSALSLLAISSSSPCRTPAPCRVVAQYGDALAGKVIIDISNTFNADATGLVIPDGTSGAQEIARAVPASAHVVKAFNTVFGHVLDQGRPLDVFFAGVDAGAKTSVSAFIESLGLRPLDVGGLEMARWLEGVGPLLMGLARHGVGNFDLALGVNLPG
jgi:hypothetical protein